MTSDGDALDRLAKRYALFATKEARGRSALYEAWAADIARDRETLAFLATLPVAKQQPNLLFAAIRHVCGTQLDWHDFRRLLIAHKQQVASVMLSRSTQTNEPARCAALLPVLAALPQPLALIEVGTSAGLCLIPDRYSYSYGEHRLHALSTSATAPPEFQCAASANTPLPREVPRIVWRVGLDPSPVDLDDAEKVAWLEMLVWPDQQDRLDNLRAAISVARRDPPRIVRGELQTDLPALAAQAPAGATVVVFHTAVLGYVDRADRLRFRDTVRALGVTWICNEAPECTSDMISTASSPPAPDSFLLSVNERPVAWADPHGRSIDWIG